jgi:hypothetical protein
MYRFGKFLFELEQEFKTPKVVLLLMVFELSYVYRANKTHKEKFQQVIRINLKDESVERALKMNFVGKYREFFEACFGKFFIFFYFFSC